MSRSRRKPKTGAAHYLAPVALLVAVTVAVLLVHSGLQHHGTSTTVSTSVQPTSTSASSTTKRPAGKGKRFYTVQTGDTYGTIAAKEGISVAQLEALNPGVSSTALQVGQKLRVQ